MSIAIAESSRASAKLQQPRGLYTLFFVEIWERFGFYCVQALLVLFLSKAYHYPDSQAYSLFSAYSALIYATPIVGGYLADRYLGFQKAIWLGTVLYTIGFFTLASAYQPLFHIALAFLISGNGFFKSSVSSLLGTLYYEGDPRRESGFTLFYMGINLGAIFAPIVCSEIATVYGWPYAFASAGIGMLICLTIIITKFKQLGNHGLAPNPERLKQRLWFPGFSQQTLIVVLALTVIPLISLLIQHGKITNYFFDFFAVVVGIGLFTLAFRYDRVQRNKLIALIALVIFSVMYWAINAQIYSSLILFADRVVDRNIFNWSMPTAMLVSVEAFFIVAFAPVAAWVWLKLKDTKWNLSTPGKFTLGLFFLGAAFLTIALAANLIEPTKFVPLFWVVVAYLFFAFSELCLSPIGLSMVTTLAPKGLTGMFMGIWFFSLSLGFALGGYLADFASIPANLTNHAEILHTYGKVFYGLGWLGVAVAVLSLLLVPLIKRLAGEKAK